LANECSFHQYIMCVYSCMWNLKREAWKVRIFSDRPLYIYHKLPSIWWKPTPNMLHVRNK
jgi:hypothetical protein